MNIEINGWTILLTLCFWPFLLYLPVVPLLGLALLPIAIPILGIYAFVYFLLSAIEAFNEMHKSQDKCSCKDTSEKH